MTKRTIQLMWGIQSAIWSASFALALCGNGPGVLLGLCAGGAVGCAWRAWTAEGWS